MKRTRTRGAAPRRRGIGARRRLAWTSRSVAWRRMRRLQGGGVDGLDAACGAKAQERARPESRVVAPDQRGDRTTGDGAEGDSAPRVPASVAPLPAREPGRISRSPKSVQFSAPKTPIPALQKSVQFFAPNDREVNLQIEVALFRLCTKRCPCVAGGNCCAAGL